MIDPGRLDRRVQFLRAGVVDDGLQARPGPFEANGAPVWAARRDVSDSERFAAGTTRAVVETRFTVRWSSLTAGITTSDRLVCEGRTYEIVGIKEIGRRQMIEVSARASV